MLRELSVARGQLRTGVLTAAALLAGTVGLCGCGAGGNPLGEPVAAAKRTLALPRTTYLATFSGDRLFPPSLELLGGAAAYDFASGIGYERLSLQPTGASERRLFLDFFPKEAFLYPEPQPAGLLPAGRNWISVSLGAHSTGDAAGKLPLQIEALAPELALDEVAWGASASSPLGSRTVAHVPLQGFRVRVDLGRALATARRAGREAVAAALEVELRAVPSRRVSVLVWVDGPGYVERIESAMPGSSLGRVAFAFSSFAVQYAETRPPSGLVAPLSSVAAPGRLWALVAGS